MPVEQNAMQETNGLPPIYPTIMPNDFEAGPSHINSDVNNDGVERTEEVENINDQNHGDGYREQGDTSKRKIRKYVVLPTKFDQALLQVPNNHKSFQAICPVLVLHQVKKQSKHGGYLTIKAHCSSEFIKLGAKWKVGSGTTIEIVGHQWLPRPPCFRREGPGPLKVRELVDEDTRQWDRAMIAYWYEPYTCVDILRTPLTNLQTNDVLIWKENKSNVFSVKSMYLVALCLLHPSTEDHSTAVTNERLWKALWSLNTPPIMRLFLWRVCSNILPTRANLHMKRVWLNSSHAMCNHQSERVKHIL
nr:hypothetical protein CFP56_40314 [Quercus suber]